MVEGDYLEYAHATQEAPGPALPRIFMGGNVASVVEG